MTFINKKKQKKFSYLINCQKKNLKIIYKESTLLTRICLSLYINSTLMKKQDQTEIREFTFNF